MAILLEEQVNLSDETYPDILAEWKYQLEKFLAENNEELAAWKESLATGNNAYEAAVKNGFVGTEEDWYNSMRGEKGDPGESAVYVSDTEPSVPCLWFDTSAKIIERTEATWILKEGSTGDVIVNVEGETYSIENATLNGEPTSPNQYDFRTI